MVPELRLRGSRVLPGGEQPARSHAQIFNLLVLVGAITVIIGSYTTWATFYAGLIARNGVSGHGKYFVGLALAAVVAALSSSTRGVWSGLRWLVVVAGVAIAVVAFRDLRNLDALIADPATGFYLPGRGNGLFILMAGAFVLILAPFARPVRTRWPIVRARTLAASTLILAVGALVPALYGEYYLHLAPRSAHDHGAAMNPAHILTLVGVGALIVFLQLAIRGYGGARSPAR